MIEEGTVVFYIDENQVYSGKVEGVSPQQTGFTFCIGGYGGCEGPYVISSGQIGRTVFFTEEEAEKELEHL